MKNNRMYRGHALGIAIGITMTFLMLAGGAVAATQVSSCGTISSPGEYVLTANLSSSSTCINITSDNVILDGAGYMITGSGGGHGGIGVYVFRCRSPACTHKKVTVENLIVTNWTDGIFYENIQEGNILNNNASNNRAGIYLLNSRHNNLIGNNASNNGAGIYLTGDDGNAGNNLIGNNASNNGVGISLVDSFRNNLTGNTANSNNGDGIRLIGIFPGCENNTLTGNTANSNKGNGIHVDFCRYNLIYNNYFNNTNNVNENGFHNNIWNITKQTGTNIVGGPYIGGNFWGDYKGIDLDGDGIGDTLLPYNSSGNIVNGGDFLPLVIPLVTPQQQIQQITTNVEGLVSSGVLNKGQGNSLIAKLDAATKNLNKGNTNAAINELQAFINEVQAYIRSKKLTQAQGQELIDAANAVISQLGS